MEELNAKYMALLASASADPWILPMSDYTADIENILQEEAAILRQVEEPELQCRDDDDTENESLVDRINRVFLNDPDTALVRPPVSFGK